MASQTLAELLRTHMTIVGDQSMKERVVRVEVMMDSGCKNFKDVLGRRMLIFPRARQRYSNKE